MRLLLNLVMIRPIGKVGIVTRSCERFGFASLLAFWCVIFRDSVVWVVFKKEKIPGSVGGELDTTGGNRQAFFIWSIRFMLVD